MINNLHTSSESIARKKEVRKLATHAVLGDASVTTPGKRTQWGEEGAGGYAEAGGRLYWQGPVEFEGSLSQIGPTTLAGPVSITGGTGTLDVAADASFGGDVAITQTLDVSAETTLRQLVHLLSDLRVEGGGKIDLGGILLESSPLGGGSVNFVPGGTVSAAGAVLFLIPPDVSTSLVLGNGRATINSDVRIADRLQVMTLPSAPSGTTLYSVVTDSAGNFYRGAPI